MSAGIRKHILLALLAGLTTVASAQRANEALIQRKLDSFIDFEASNMPIEGVFSKLGHQTGVKFLVTQDALDLLPYGSQTNLDVEFKQVRMRDALDRLLSKQALDWEIRDGIVHILPSPPLYRMLHRPSFDELAMLSGVMNAQLKPGDGPADALDQLREAVEEPKLRLAIHVPASREELLTRASLHLPATGREWLNDMTHGKGWTWFVSGDAIVILDRKAQMTRQLQQRVSLRYRNARLVNVLLELSTAARAKLHLQPGVLMMLPETQRESLNLIMADATVDQALEVISGATGLVFDVVDDGIRIEASDYLKQEPVVSASTPRKERPPFFVKESLKLESMSVEVFYTADDLPEDVIEKILTHRESMIERLRDFKP
jgi:hypothetical protein